MKKRIISIMSLVLALLLFCSPTVSAAALTEETAAQKGAEVFEAWDIINHSNYKYMTTEYKGPYRMFVDDLKSNPAWVAELTAWRVTTFNLKSEVSYADKEYGYYEEFLFNILYDDDSKSLGTSFISTANKAGGDVEKNWKRISASTWKKLCELDVTLKDNPQINKDNIEVISSNLKDNLGSIQDVYDSMEIIGNLTDCLGYCTTVLDAVEKISKLEALLQISEETATIIKEMAESCEKGLKSNLFLSSVLKKMASFLSGTLSEEDMVALFAGEAAVSTLSEEMASLAWKKATAAMAEVGVAITAGQTVGKFTTDTLFNTSGVIGKYYKMNAMCEFEDVMLSETVARQGAFESNPTPETAKKFIAAYKLLYKTYLEGLNCASSFVKAQYEDGWWNQIKRLMGENEYQDVLKSIESLKTSVSSVLDYYDTRSFNYYQEVLGSIQGDVDVISAVSLTPAPEVDIEPDTEIVTIQTEVKKYSDLVFSKNVTLDEDLTTYGNVTITGGTLSLDGHSITVHGDLRISGGTVNLQRGTITVSGNIYHTWGEVALNKGTLNVSGDYRAQIQSTNSAGESVWSQSYARLTMNNTEDSVTVGGGFYWSGNSNNSDGAKLGAGTLTVGGDFLNSNNGFFYAYGSHKVVLNGTGEPQHITFASGSSYSSYFNILELTRDGSYYVFSPDPCWKTLREAGSPVNVEVPVTNISLNARTVKLAPGAEYQLTATVYPDNASDPTLDWSSSDSNIASVDENGLVSAVSVGTATIRVTAANGLYRSCTVTVYEVLSGTLSVGTLNALPGEEVSVPVIAWDNPGIAALRVTMTYNTDILAPKEVRAGDKLSADNLSFEDHSGSVNILWYDAEDMKSDGVLFYMVFQVSDAVALDTEAVIGLQTRYGDICMADHTNISFSTENGSLLIKDVLKGDIYEDGVVDVHDILLLQKYLTSLETLNGRQMAAADLTGDGSVDMKDIVKLAQTLLADTNLMSLFGIGGNSVADSDFIVRVEDAVFGTDGYVTVPVTFSGCPGVAAFRLRVDYDTTLLELASIDAVSELVQENLCDNLSDSEREATWVTWYNANDQIVDGTAFTLRFKLRDTTFDGIVPVSLEIRDNDVCTAALMELSLDAEYGIVHTASYSSDVQVVDAAISEGAKAITGTIICGQDVSGMDALVVAAFYDEYGRMLGSWTNAVQLENNGQFSVTGNIDTYSEVKLFIVSDDQWIPLCPSVENITA